MLRGYNAYSGLSLKATCITPTTKTLTSLALSGSSSVNESSYSNYTARAYFSDGTNSYVTSSAIWSENSSYASMSSSVKGRLNTSSVTSNKTVTVTASYTYNGVTKSWSKLVTIVNVTVACGTSSNPCTLSCGQTISSISGSSGSLRYYKIVVPSNKKLTKIETFGGSGDCDLYVKKSSVPTTSSYDCRPYKSGNTESCTSFTTNGGTYYIMLKGYNAYSGVSLKATCTTPTPVDAYEPDNSRSAAQNIALDQVQSHTINPSGDLDWIRFAPPSAGTYTITIYDVTTALSGEAWIKQGLLPEIKTDLITVPSGGSLPFVLNAVTGTQYIKIMIKAQSSSATGQYKIKITAGGGGNDTCSSAITVSDGVAKTGLSGSSGSLKYYKITCPSNATSLQVKTSGGSGDVDLYVKKGSCPTTSSYDCRPYKSGNTETCNFSSGVASQTYYVMLRGYNSYSGVTLLAEYGGGGGSADNYEPDNSRSAAQNIALDQVQSHTINPSGDLDWIRFAPPSAGTYTITIYDVTTALSGEAWIKQGLLPEIKTDLLTIPSGGSLPFVLNADSGTQYIKIMIEAQSSSSTGQYKIKITAGGGGGTTCSGAITLSDDVAKTGLSGTSGSNKYYKITCPSNTMSLQVKTYSGSGDVDLYVRKGSCPTTSSYDCRPYKSGNTETCNFSSGVGGQTYYIMLRGYSSYSGVTLLADYVW